MATKTKIEWTECSWNPVTGCTKISEGCQNCYAAKFAKRLKAMGNPRYKNAFDITVHEDLIEAPMHWKTPRTIFVNSMSDLFHEKIPDEIICKIFKVMNTADWHTFQVLTKRSERLLVLSNRLKWTKNIWMGVSVENSDYLYRVDHLRQIGAWIKFVSAEPLLSDLTGIDFSDIHWLIVGGESGPGSRPINEQWVINLKELALQNKVAFFFKQWGGVNKKKNGRILDGQTYDEYPQLTK